MRATLNDSLVGGYIVETDKKKVTHIGRKVGKKYPICQKMSNE